MRISTAKPNGYLERILKARVYDVAIESPLELAPGLSKRLGNRLLLKREDLQPVFLSNFAAPIIRWQGFRHSSCPGASSPPARETMPRESPSPPENSAATR